MRPLMLVAVIFPLVFVACGEKTSPEKSSPEKTGAASSASKPRVVFYTIADT